MKEVLSVCLEVQNASCVVLARGGSGSYLGRWCSVHVFSLLKGHDLFLLWRFYLGTIMPFALTTMDGKLLTCNACFD